MSPVGTRPKPESSPPTRPPRSRSIAVILLSCLGCIASCNGKEPAGPPPVPSTGWIEVVTSTDGVELDPDGYVVSVFSADPGGGPTIESRVLSVTDRAVFTREQPGDYIVELSDVAQNCELAGPRLRDVSVAAGDTTTTEFQFTCFLSAPLKGKIVFSTDRDGGRPEIYAMDFDGSGLFNLSRDPGASDITPAVSHDGTQVAYASDRAGNFDIYYMNANGTGKTRYTVRTTSEQAPALSLEDSLAYQEGTSQSSRVIVTRQIISLGFLTKSPSWSPGGTKIAVADDFYSNLDVWLYDLEASSVTDRYTRLTSNAATDDDPAWSPDGSKIAFASDRDGNFEIYLIDIDGTNLVRLTDHPGADRAPAWSADGRRIAFETDRDGNFEIYVMNADGTGLLNLTNHPADDRDPVWSP